MADDIVRTAAQLLRKGGLSPAEKRRARARIRAKAEASRRGGYGGGFEEAVNWRGLAGYRTASVGGYAQYRAARPVGPWNLSRKLSPLVFG